MRSAVLTQFEVLSRGLPDWRARPEPELAPSCLAGVDAVLGGVPRGCLTAIHGPASSGRTTLLLALLAAATGRGEHCALVDSEDSFDPVSAAAVGVHLKRLLWARCGGDAGQALRVADLLVQGGGFGMVALDLGDTPVRTARRISLTSWFRLRRAVEHTPTVLLALGRESCPPTCTTLALECTRETALWQGARPGRFLGGTALRVTRQKPLQRVEARITAPA
jgi:hypothetical protein